MGGINHQPTKGQMVFSTMLSQYFTGSLAKLMLANYELEHALLSEFDGAPPTRIVFLIDRARRELADSKQLLVNAIDAIDYLVAQMGKLEYVDPSRSMVSDYKSLGNDLSQQGLIPLNEQIWYMISQVRQKEAFFGVCRLFRERFLDLITQTEDLEAMFDLARRYAEDGMLIPAVDENRIPFRQSFFQLLTKVIETLTMFLHSAVMSTEMYYRQEGYGSLISKQQEAMVV
jgi:hypothetical protein